MTSTISRRQILSRSRDTGLDYHKQQQNRFAPYEDYEEMWFTHEHLFKDHIAEVLRKWQQIDDEIWAKMIFMSRNRRIAKAYVRVPAVIIDGSDNGFDGYRVGLNGFEDPFRDCQTDQLMNHIDKGCRIGIDHSGNILIKRYSQSSVFVKCYPLDYSRSCVDNQIIRSNGVLEAHKKYVLFDMEKFEIAMMNELKSAYPDRTKLEQQCIVVIGFVRDNHHSILNVPIYVMLINIVALDMLKSKLSPVLYQTVTTSSSSNTRIPEFVSIFDRMKQTNNQTTKVGGDCCQEEEEEEEEPIYGQIGMMSLQQEWAAPMQARHHRTTSRNRTTKANTNKTRNKPSMQNGTITINRDWATIQRPPKLPPRDHRQKKRTQQYLENNIEIPSPDYHEPPPQCPQQRPQQQSQQTTLHRRPKSSNSTKTNAKSTIKASNNKPQATENIYGTIVVNGNGGGGGHRSSSGMMMASDDYRWQRWTNQSNNNSSVYHRSFNNRNDHSMIDGTIKNHHLIMNHIVDEDPYYSGLEARVTNHHKSQTNQSSNEQTTKVPKGLNWMMRKVLSSNYINLLTLKRNGKNATGSSSPAATSTANQTYKSTSKCSTNESSTDSDPYVSINDMYEPIYGRFEHQHWPTYRPFK